MNSETSSNVPLEMKKGDRFSSVQEFDKILKTESKKKFVQFYRRDSRRIEAAKKNVKRYLNPNLEYYQLKYCCIHGGKPFVPSGQGKRKTKTLKQDVPCPANVILRAADNGNELEILAINTLHNHIVDKILYQHLPQQRQLPEEVKNEAKKLLSLKANKHLIRQELEEKTGQIITLKDLSNLKYRDRLRYENSIETAVTAIKEKFDTLDSDQNSINVLESDENSINFPDASKNQGDTDLGQIISDVVSFADEAQSQGICVENEPIFFLQEHDYCDNNQDAMERITENSEAESLDDEAVEVVPEENICGNNATTSIKEIKLPPVLKKRGRPSGSDVTAIGLPRRKSKRKTYSNLTNAEKTKTVFK